MRSGAAWAAKLAAASPLIAELTALIVAAPDHPLIVCHRDFSPANVLPRAPGGQLVVLDWENAGSLQAGRELGYVLLAWAISEPAHRGYAEEQIASLLDCGLDDLPRSIELGSAALGIS